MQNIVEVLLFSLANDRLQILLIPSGDKWKLPSRMVEERSIDETVVEVIEQSIKTSQPVYFHQMYSLAKPSKTEDRVISISYFCLVCLRQSELNCQGEWFEIAKQTEELSETTRKSLLTLRHQTTCIQYEVNDEVAMNYIAKDSKLTEQSDSELDYEGVKIVNMAMDRLQHEIASSGLLFNLLGETFTLKQAQKAYEAVMNKKVDTPNFRRDIVKMLKPTGVTVNQGRKQAMTYRFNPLFQYLREDL